MFCCGYPCHLHARVCGWTELVKIWPWWEGQHLIVPYSSLLTSLQWCPTLRVWPCFFCGLHSPCWTTSWSSGTPGEFSALNFCIYLFCLEHLSSFCLCQNCCLVPFRVFCSCVTLSEKLSLTSRPPHKIAVFSPCSYILSSHSKLSPTNMNSQVRFLSRIYAPCLPSVSLRRLRCSIFFLCVLRKE